MTDSDHIMQLRKQVANLHGLLVKALAERDEARREVCEWLALSEGGTEQEHADEAGWYCFKENP
jgi:hypothetical protein